MEPRIEIEELLTHASWLRGLAESLVADPARADDLVQETWIAARRRPPRALGSPRPWLARVLRNFDRNARRGEERRARHESLGRWEREPQDPAELAREAEAQRRLAEAVTRLEEPLRDVIVLRYFRGLASAEIGRELDLAPSAVRSRLQKALDELRARLDREFGGREAWCAWLAPLSGKPSVAGTATAGSAMLLLKSAAVVAALAAAGFLTWRVARPAPPQATASRDEATAPAGAPGSDKESSSHDAPIAEDRPIAA